MPCSSPAQLCWRLKGDSSGHLLPSRERFFVLRPQLSYEWYVCSPGDCSVNLGGRIAGCNEDIAGNGNPSTCIFPTVPAQPFHFPLAVFCFEREGVTCLNDCFRAPSCVHSQSPSARRPLPSKIQQALKAFLAEQRVRTRLYVRNRKVLRTLKSCCHLCHVLSNSRSYFTQTKISQRLDFIGINGFCYVGKAYTRRKLPADPNKHCIRILLGLVQE